MKKYISLAFHQEWFTIICIIKDENILYGGWVQKHIWNVVCAVCVCQKDEEEEKKRRNEMEMEEKFFIIRKQCVLINGKDVYEATIMMMMMMISSSLIFLSSVVHTLLLLLLLLLLYKWEGRNKIKCGESESKQWIIHCNNIFNSKSNEFVNMKIS